MGKSWHFGVRQVPRLDSEPRGRDTSSVVLTTSSNPQTSAFSKLGRFSEPSFGMRLRSPGVPRV